MHSLHPHSSLNRAAPRPTIPVESREAALSRCPPLNHRGRDGRRPDQGMRSGSGASALCAVLGDANELPAWPVHTTSQAKAVEMEPSL